jgi:hypothetical protein
LALHLAQLPNKKPDPSSHLVAYEFLLASLGHAKDVSEAKPVALTVTESDDRTSGRGENEIHLTHLGVVAHRTSRATPGVAHRICRLAEQITFRSHQASDEPL